MNSATLSAAPMRLSIAGGGTDLPEFYRTGPARVVSVAIDRWVKVAVASRPAAARAAAGLDSPGHRYVLDLPGSADQPFLRAAREALGVDSGCHLAVTSSVTPGSGLGGSGAFAVALLDALSRFNGRTLEPADLAELSFEVERRRLKRVVGKQDGWTAAIGGAVELLISARGEVRARARPDVLDAMTELLGTTLLLFRTPGARDAARVLSRARNISARERAQVRSLTDENERAFLSRDWARIGEVLRRHWRQKVSSNPSADHPICRRLLAEGAEIGIAGFKLVGAGGGGHLLVAVEPARRLRVSASLRLMGLVQEDVRPVRCGLVRAEPGARGESCALVS